MRYPDEPHVVLTSGQSVHLGALSLLEDLTASGHALILDQDGDVVVVPDHDLHEDTQWALEAFDEDLRILLQSGADTIH